MTLHRRRIRRRHVVLAAALGLVLVAAGAVAADAGGSREKLENLARKIELLVNPPPDREIAAMLRVTPEPLFEEPTPEPAATVAASVAPGEPTPAPTPSPTPKPERVKVDVNLLDDPDGAFVSQDHKDWCAVAGTQIVLAMHGASDLSVGSQREIADRIDEWESRRDSRNGGWGPASMVAALDTYGVPGYEVRGYESRGQALRDAAKAISTYNAPVILLVWRGAHTWVMTGYRADADPLVFKDARVSGTYVLDPWFPRISSIWGASEKPGSFKDLDELRYHYRPWQRPEGTYPDRDGLFIAVVPTQPLDR